VARRQGRRVGLAFDQGHPEGEACHMLLDGVDGIEGRGEGGHYGGLLE